MTVAACEALGSPEQVLKLRLNTNGMERPETIMMMQNLALFYELAGRVEDALKNTGEGSRVEQEATSTFLTYPTRHLPHNGSANRTCRVPTAGLGDWSPARLLQRQC